MRHFPPNVPLPASLPQASSAATPAREPFPGQTLRIATLGGDAANPALGDALGGLLRAHAEFQTRAFPGLASDWSAADAAAFQVFDPDLVIVCAGSEALASFGATTEIVRRDFPQRPILVVTADAACAAPLAFCQLGASDFIIAPLRPEDLVPRLWRLALAARRPEQLVRAVKERIGLQRIIGESEAFRDALCRLPQIARSQAPVLISGESGSGKEVFARAIHYLGPHAGHPFVCVNCGAIPEPLVESELFGHKRGAFTGAIAERTGLVAEAEGGTLFLDEVDSLPRLVQVKLLRLLQDGEYRMVGSPKVEQAHVRVIAAGNAEFSQLVQQGGFREDLFYRLNVLRLALPPLRQRRSDIPALARHFLEKQALQTGEPVKTLSPAAIDRLVAHDWPGNVRELENILARAHVFAAHAVLQPADLDLPATPTEANLSLREMKDRVVRQFEHDYLRDIVRTHEGNITQAARAAGKNRRAFYELLRKHGLPCVSR